MSNEEAEVVVAPVSGRNVDIVDEIDQVERKPADAEDSHHSDQHPVGSTLPLPVRFFFAARLGPWLATRPVVQLHRHFDVAEGDDGERHHKLKGSGNPSKNLKKYNN